MLRPDLAPFDVYLADAMLLSEEEFFDRHPFAALVIPEPDAAVLRELSRPETLIPGQPLPALYDFLDPQSEQARGASLDALVLAIRPKDGESFDRITIGRAPEADIVLLDETISKFHAEVSWEVDRQRCVVTDLDSRNGTYVGEARLPNRGHVELSTGAVVSFGTLLGRYYPPRAFLAWLSTGASRAGAVPSRKQS